jgi:hypothetical protein
MWGVVRVGSHYHVGSMKGRDGERNEIENAEHNRSFIRVVWAL